ncbi:phosphoenolpyruvate--protein phosphotransferase [Saccharopolyspora rectivirgula]|jgi:phosphotransferase system enzyme I (PtsI)|uniref:Phosphoenolpyruvate-protein phosphotransferase n=1 Tax=Saccharopolyspora rectivirgula TaxID=28042 RepID=A0A073AXG8_9PSEU|nr:phosphoenolpyruvate--protein phosphotransferase [Saccharopolyspora rectivirgula]KEI43752.1 phosphoenolpyruvate-protein phosphotransferase [Saccharopolyspora rectivirgula]
MSRLTGVGVSPGQASGPVARVAETVPEPASTPAPADPAAEAARIQPAAQAVSDRLFERASRVTGDAKTLLETTAAMAIDPALISEAEQLVTSRSLPAARAVHEAAAKFTEALRAAGGYMAERVRDVQDVRDRIVAELLGLTPPGVPDLTEPCVLVARDLAPADTADLDTSLVLGLVTEEGGPTSHTAILARSLGIPAVVGVRGLLELSPVMAISLDGDTGLIEASSVPLPVRASERSTATSWQGEGATADGHRIKVLANVGAAVDARTAASAGAEGVGLFRTEFCFLAADREPDVSAQRSAYAAVLAPFADKPVIVRTLDAGADKPLPFLAMGAEPNPALGVRGLRISQENPDLLERQLEAVAAAASDSGADVSVMAPMVSTAEEAAWFVERAKAAGIDRAGVMIEVPAAALTAREVLREVDFVSLGTNDLAQYLFAADRMAGALAELNDPWQPALLRLIAEVGRAGAELGKPVGVCGEAAADPLLAGVLVGLGVTSLSMGATAIPAVGSALGEHPLQTYQETAREVLEAASARKAREIARARLRP